MQEKINNEYTNSNAPHTPRTKKSPQGTVRVNIILDPVTKGLLACIDKNRSEAIRKAVRYYVASEM